MPQTQEIIKSLEKIKSEYSAGADRAKSAAELADWKARYLGKKGELAAIMSSLGGLSVDDKKIAGRLANEIKTAVEEIYEKSIRSIHESEYIARLGAVSDLTLPSVGVPRGRTHPLSDTMEEISSIFVSLGFAVADGPEIEDDYHNFAALNFPDSHPAKEMQDTFYVSSEGAEKLLRTHTSPVQIRSMKGGTPPFKFIAPGRVYRHEAVDATHSYVFHQVEGFCVDKKTNLADLKTVLETFIEKFFGKKSSVRFRPSYFPFTEPSVEVDVECLVCSGAGCKACKNSGFIELLGAGMIHPNVLSNCGLDPNVWQGYAFGIGVERFAMQKYGVDDMRLFYKNEMRFLRQF
ncbi:MAG: phenylalanine--tRNA ligase subunit alpha [Elusimicrobia bacterium HGW-Elusimicrobia-1]|jgi:phenylalanyl-tRNA synthetase alpha chain|nr:MAG: phenylalanine--tRNA ligase subunit alpha [Elusimicrobia bacterium HGW-Elusimicrobia-1]